MPQLPKTSALLLLIVALAGCAAWPPRPPAPVPAPAPAPPPPPAPVCPPAPAPEGRELKALLAYQADLHTRSAADLAHELATLNEQQALSPELAMRKALVLNLGRSAAELALAQAQLEAVIGSAEVQAEVFKPLAGLLVLRVAEQRRLLESMDKLSLQVRESQRRGDQLAEKLEALKAIEHTLPGLALQPATAASGAGR